MKINSKKLVEFLEKVTLKGAIPSAVLKTTNKGMVANMSLDNVILSKGILLREAFTEYKEGLNIPLGSTSTNSDVDLLIKLLKGFSGEILMKVEKSGSVLSIQNEKRIATINLSDEEFVQNKCEKELKIDFDPGFRTGKTEILRKVTQNISTLSSKNYVPDVEITVEKGILWFKTISEHSKIMENIEIDYKDCDIKIAGDRYNQVFGSLGEDLNISIVDYDKPLQVKEIGENIMISIIIAPKIDLERQKESKEEVEKNPTSDQKKTHEEELKKKGREDEKKLEPPKNELPDLGV